MPMGSDRAGDSGWTMVPTLLHRLLGKHPLREVKATAKVGLHPEAAEQGRRRGEREVAISVA